MEIYTSWFSPGFYPKASSFLLFINDIVTDIGSNIRRFADDTSLFIIVENPDTAAELFNWILKKL